MQCHATTKTGKRCEGFTLSGSNFCFAHDPNHEEERNQARKKGGRVGKAKTLPENEPDLSLAVPTDVEALLADTINRTRRGELDAKTANTIGYLSGQLLKAFEYGKLAEEITLLKQRVENRTT